MKMNKIFNIFIIAGLSLFFFSCSNFLDEKGYQKDYSYFDNAGGVDAAVIGCYQPLRWAPSYENGFVVEDMGTDIYMIGADGGTRDAFGRFLSSSMNSNQGNLSSLWNNNYKGISDVNLTLDYLAANTAIDSIKRKVRKGELLFLRAFYYHELVTQFGNIPLILKTEMTPKTDYVRVPQKQIWAQIISDARAAYDLLPWADAAGKVSSDGGKTAGDQGRVSKGSAGHLLAKAYMYRYYDKYTKSQSDANMNEDRGGLASDIDSCIYYASRVCNFGAGAGAGSKHALCPDFSTLWGWDQKTGITTEYWGPEVVLSINYSNSQFLNNTSVTDINSGGNWNHMLYTMYAESYPLTTANGLGKDPAVWGSNIGIARSLMTGRAWRRLAPTPYYYKDDGIWSASHYETGKKGKLVDARLYKGHVWVWYCNTTPTNVTWGNFTNAAGTFNASSKGKNVGDVKYGIGDTAIVLSLEDVTQRPGWTAGTKNEKLALARAQEGYWYVPLNTIQVPTQMSEVGNRDALCNAFLTPTKYLDNRRAANNDQAGFRNFYRFRLAETYLMLSEAYARKGDFDNASAALNIVRQRAAWKAGQTKYVQYWKYDGGDWATRSASTEADMSVSKTFLGNMTDAQLTDFYVEEMAKETMGEMNRFSTLVKYGADYWYNRVKTYNHFAAPTIQKWYRFRPIPQSHIDLTNPKDPNPQNYGY